jgi:hypothetical protein
MYTHNTIIRAFGISEVSKKSEILLLQTIIIINTYKLSQDIKK